MWEKADFGPAAAAFPGAGIRSSGFEATFFQRHRPQLKSFLARASDYAGVDLREALEQEGLDRLKPRDVQLFTFACSLGVLDTVRAHGVEPVLMAGHSLGIYAALTGAGCVSFEDGLFLVDRACDLATKACRDRNCGMVATAGLTRDEVDGILGDLDASSLRRVITNSPMSMVVAGDLAELDSFVAAAEEAEATRLVWLDREVAYHHPDFLDTASRELATVVKEIPWRDPRVPVVSSIDARVLDTAEGTKDFTIRNLSSPIDWEAVVVVLADRRVRTVFECGPGTTLTRMGRFVDADLKYLNVKKISRRGG